jgi:hypothetical protein
MKISAELLEQIDHEKLKEQMLESLRMGSGLKDQIVDKLFSGIEVALPQEMEDYLKMQIPNWLKQNQMRQKNKNKVA